MRVAVSKPLPLYGRMLSIAKVKIGGRHFMNPELITEEELLEDTGFNTRARSSGGWTGMASVIEQAQGERSAGCPSKSTAVLPIH